jgi:3-oxoadipate enol-lactonase
MPFFERSGAALYYEIHGTGGPWIAFAHGAGGNHLSWWQQVPAFADRYRCLVYAQRGWGRSIAAPDPAALATDLVALLDHVGAERVTLVGQSMGGWAVLGCALEIRERVTRLLLTGTIAGLSDDAMLAALAAQRSASPTFESRLALAPDFPARQPALTFLYEAIAALNPPPTPAFIGALVRLRYTAGVHTLTMPVSFLAGEQDQLFPPAVIRAAHAKLPAAELHFVPTAGHSVYFERADVFNAQLAAFLRREGRDGRSG